MSIQAQSRLSENPPASARNRADEGLWALVPVKQLTFAKQRLDDFLGSGRVDFALAMLTDVLDALAHSKVVKHVAVITADSTVVAMAKLRGLLVIEEHGHGEMNAAIAQGMEAIRQQGGRLVAIIPSDIPLLTGLELDRLAGIFLHQSSNDADGKIGISPSSDRGGTNILFINAQRPFELLYGPDSFRLHCESARSRNQEVVTMISPTVSMDIDGPEDVEELLAFYQQHREFQHSRTWCFLQSRHEILDRQD